MGYLDVLLLAQTFCKQVLQVFISWYRATPGGIPSNKWVKPLVWHNLYHYCGLYFHCVNMRHLLLFVRATTVAPEDPEMSQKGTASKRKCLTLKILQKLKIIRGLEDGRNQREVMASYNTGSSTVYDIKKQKDQLWSFMTLSENVNDIFKWLTLKEPKLARLDKALYKYFTGMCSNGKSVTGHRIIGRP